MPHGRPPQQLALDFTSRINEALATIRAAGQRLATQLAPDQAAGLVDLLERVALTSQDHTHSQARASRLAAGLHDRRAVSERTIRRWRQLAENYQTPAGPLLSVDHRSTRWGGHATNTWAINWPAVQSLAQGQLGTPPEPPPARADQASAAPSRPRDRAPAAPPTDTWLTVAGTLAGWGLRATDKITAAARAAGQTPDQAQAAARAALATAHANAALFRDPPAAAAYFLTRGSWPAQPGAMIDPAAQARAADRREHDAREIRRESHLAATVAAGRRAGQEEHAIAAQLAQALPAEWLAARGWTVPEPTEANP